MLEILQKPSVNKQLLHTPPLNTNGEGCATIVYTESVEKNNEMKKGKKTKNKQSVAQTWLDLNSASLGFEE